MIVRESIDFQRNLDPKDSMGIGSGYFKNKLINILKQSYDYGYSAQDFEHWGFTQRLWNATMKKLLKPETIVHITDEHITISSPKLSGDNVFLITNALNFRRDEWNIRGVESEPGKTKLTFAKKLSEGLNFQRGLDPKEAMDIGDRDKREMLKYCHFVVSTGKFKILQEVRTKDSILGPYLDFRFCPDNYTNTPKIIIEKYKGDIVKSIIFQRDTANDKFFFQDMAGLKKNLEEYLYVNE